MPTGRLKVVVLIYVYKCLLCFAREHDLSKFIPNYLDLPYTVKRDNLGQGGNLGRSLVLCYSAFIPNLGTLMYITKESLF